MLAKPGCDGVLAAASFSMRVNMSTTNRFQVLKKKAYVPDDCIAALGPVKDAPMAADIPPTFQTHIPAGQSG
jgi:hypothetical protein